MQVGIRGALFIAVMFLMAAAPACQAQWFGRVDTAFAHFSNFNGAAGNTSKLSENALSESLGGGWLEITSPHTAVYAHASINHNNFTHSHYLNDTQAHFSLGGFYAFTPRYSVFGNLGVGGERFQQSARDDLIATVRGGVKEHPVPALSFEEAAFYHHGTHRTLLGRYSGYGASTVARYALRRRLTVSAGMHYTQTHYHYQGNRSFNIRTEGVHAGAKWRFHSPFFATASLAYQFNTPNYAPPYQGLDYTLGLGARF